MIGYVYLTTNDLNDIKYIGKSAYGFRWEYAEMGWTV